MPLIHYSRVFDEKYCKEFPTPSRQVAIVQQQGQQQQQKEEEELTFSTAPTKATEEEEEESDGTKQAFQQHEEAFIEYRDKIEQNLEQMNTPPVKDNSKKVVVVDIPTTDIHTMMVDATRTYLQHAEDRLQQMTIASRSCSRTCQKSFKRSQHLRLRLRKHHNTTKTSDTTTTTMTTTYTTTPSSNNPTCVRCCITNKELLQKVRKYKSEMETLTLCFKAILHKKKLIVAIADIHNPTTTNSTAEKNRNEPSPNSSNNHTPLEQPQQSRTTSIIPTSSMLIHKTTSILSTKNKNDIIEKEQQQQAAKLIEHYDLI